MKKYYHYIEYIIVRIFFCLFRIIGIDCSSYLTGKLARLIGPFLKINHIARINLKIAFPGIDLKHENIIIKEMWENLGRVFGEFPHIYNMSEDEFNKRVKITGIENLYKMKEKGGIFFSAHLANWEICARVPLLIGLKISLIYRHANNLLVDELICRERKSKGVQIISKGTRDVKKLFSALKNFETIGMLIDQKMNEGEDILFFNRFARTSTAISRLASNFNCPIIPAQLIRLKGANFIIKIHPEIEINPEDSSNTNMLKIHEHLESWIKENPSQWFWLHRRYPKDIYKSEH